MIFKSYINNYQQNDYVRMCGQNTRSKLLLYVYVLGGFQQKKSFSNLKMQLSTNSLLYFIDIINNINIDNPTHIINKNSCHCCPFVIYFLFFKISDKYQCKEYNHMSFAQKPSSHDGLLTSSPFQLLCATAQHVAASPQLSSPLLSGAPCPFSSSVSLQNLISSSVFSSKTNKTPHKKRQINY